MARMFTTGFERDGWERDPYDAEKIARRKFYRQMADLLAEGRITSSCALLTDEGKLKLDGVFLEPLELRLVADYYERYLRDRMPRFRVAS